MFLVTYLFECINYKILFNIDPPPGKHHGEKVLLSDVTVPFGQCAAHFSFQVLIPTFLGLSVLIEGINE